MRKNATPGTSARSGGSSSQPTLSQGQVAEHIHLTHQGIARVQSMPNLKQHPTEVHQPLDAVCLDDHQPQWGLDTSEAFQKHFHFSTEHQKSFSTAFSFWDVSFTPNMFLSISVLPSPLLSCLHSSRQINSLKRLPVWCNFMFLNTVFSGALLWKFNFLRNRSDTFNRMKHKCSLWLPGESLCWAYNKVCNLQSCYQEKKSIVSLSHINNFGFLKIMHLNN